MRSQEPKVPASPNERLYVVDCPKDDEESPDRYPTLYLQVSIAIREQTR